MGLTSTVLPDSRIKKVIYEPINPMSAMEMLSNRSRGRAISGVVWQFVRLPVLVLLVILEPIIVLLCGGLALLGTLTAIFFTVIHAPHFPVWTILCLSLGFMLTLISYEGLICVLSD